MKFYGNGLVWDAIKKKPLCRFVDGVFETGNTAIAHKLISLGHDCVDADLINITTLSDIEEKYISAPIKHKSSPRKKKVIK